MKRAVEAHEDTMIAVQIVQLIEMFKSFPEYFCENDPEIIQVITDFNQAMSEYQCSVFKELFLRFQDLMLNVNFKEKWDAFRQSKASNLQFEFFTIYTNMVRRLLEFIQASRARNWMQHLSAGEALMKDIISMDRIKYRKGFIVYLADMKNLQNSNEDIWKYFM